MDSFTPRDNLMPKNIWSSSSMQTINMTMIEKARFESSKKMTKRSKPEIDRALIVLNTPMDVKHNAAIRCAPPLTNFPSLDSLRCSSTHSLMLHACSEPTSDAWIGLGLYTLAAILTLAVAVPWARNVVDGRPKFWLGRCSAHYRGMMSRRKAGGRSSFVAIASAFLMGTVLVGAASALSRRSHSGCSRYTDSLCRSARVRRGPDWKWSNQDGGDAADSLGTVTSTSSSSGWCTVSWDKGGSNYYRVGAGGGNYDLCLWCEAGKCSPGPRTRNP